MNYSEVEAKVREATNDDTWGPHGSLMSEIAKFTYTYEHYPEVMSMLWKRMFESRKNWRRTYKALLLLHYLIRNGSERVVTSAREHIYDMKPLEEYTFRDERGKDQGLNVRQKAKEIMSFLQDDVRLREARKAAKETRDKYVGYSSEEMSGRYSDRYDPEPRSRSHRNSGSTYQDEPAHKSAGYHDENGEVSGKSYAEDRDPPYSDQTPPPETKAEESEPSQSEETKSSADPTPGSKKSAQPSKLVDLGAAAAFASQSENNPPQGQTTGAPTGAGNLLDVFGDMSLSGGQQPQAQAQGGFANFQSAFHSQPPQPEAQAVGSPGFGDFAAFQSSTVHSTPPQPQLQTQPQPSFADFGGFQGTSAQPQIAGGGLLQPQPASGGALLQPQGFPTQQPQQKELLTENRVKTPEKPTVWSSPGVNIDIDNLMSPPSKTTTTTAPPSMNQLATSTQTQASSFAGGPNYNINTAALMGQVPVQQPYVAMGMGSRPGIGMGPSPGIGMGPSPGMGVGYGGAAGMGVGMGYGTGMYAGAGGYGARPMAMGGYGMQPPMMGGPGMNPNPMGMQQRRL